MTERKQLVLEHLEDISWRGMEHYPETLKGLIRGRAGIYVLYRKDKLYYVGLARNLMGRLKSHLRDRHHGAWDRFSVYLTLLDEHMKELESLILRITAPKGNKVGGKFVKSLNLRATLNHEMQEYDADRRGRLLGGTFDRRRRRAKARHPQGKVPLAGVVEHGTVLRAQYKGVRYRAILRRDGQIGFKDKLYNGPKQAAFAVIGRSVNGWNFWKYKEDGTWLPLSTVRG